MKPITFLADSLDAIRAFPETARREAGFQLDKIQHGYVAKLEHAVYVLHAFQKKTQKTAKADLDLARVRFKALMRK